MGAMRVRAADEAAFREFVSSRSAVLVRSAFLLTGDLGLAEDAVQSVLSRLYRNWWRIRDREALDGYCRKALAREVSSWRRKRQVELVLTAELPEHPVVDSVAGDVEDRIRRALLALPARQRSVLVLRYWEDMSEADVATVLGVSVGTVKQHTHRGTAALRAALVRPEVLSEES